MTCASFRRIRTTGSRASKRSPEFLGRLVPGSRRGSASSGIRPHPTGRAGRGERLAWQTGSTRRRADRRLVALLVVGADRRHAWRCALQEAQDGDGAGKKPRSRSSSRRPTSRTSSRSRCRAGSRCPGTMQPLQPGDGQGQGVGRRAPDHGPRRRTGAGRAAAGAHRHRRPRGEAHRAQGRAGKSAKAQLALAEKTRAMNNRAPEAELHLAERVRQLASRATSVAQGNVKSVGGPGAARAERARRMRSRLPR